MIACLAIVPYAGAQSETIPTGNNPRIIVLTDIGGDPDDQQSFTRFLLYANQFDIEGLLSTSIRIFPEHEHRPPDGAPQPQYLIKWIDAYGHVRDNLLKQSMGWPHPDSLRRMVKKGTRTGRDGPFNIRMGVAGESSGHYSIDQLFGEGKDTGA